MQRKLEGVLSVPGRDDRPVVVSVDGEPQDDGSLVSCLMVSRGNLFPSRYAVECFRRQTHPNRELVVVVDDPDCELLAHLATLGDPRIRSIVLSGPKKTLGELRNISVANARGDYVCQWDDDDLYAPERIRLQLAMLTGSGASACLLSRWTLWWPAAHRLAISGVRRWEGSLLASRGSLPDYPALRRGEDTEMVDALAQSAPIVDLDAPDLYLYVHHGGNTFEATHFVALYNFSRRRWVGRDAGERLTEVAATIPLRQYEAELAATARVDAGPGSLGTDGDVPLVSIIVRSMGRAHLRPTLESLAAQDYPNLDVIVVDATGGTHPPLPEIAWRPGHGVRLVTTGVPLPRPRAANAGLDALRGAWFGFLDDDDTFDPEHVSVLMAAALATDRRVVYGMSRLVGADGETTSTFGLPFNRATLFHAPLCAFAAALFHREVAALGCRFDEALEIFEDQDFFRQVAQHTDFTCVGLATFNYRIEEGTSGTGRGANRNWVRGPVFEQRLRAKWAGDAAYHLQRVTRAIQRALHAYRRQDLDAAHSILDAAQAEYPDDPNVLNALGYLSLAAGRIEEAETTLRRAIDINPMAGEYRLNRAAALERQGRLSSARRELAAARVDPSVRDAAHRALMRRGGVPMPTAGHAFFSPASRSAGPSRTAPCPCGSGKRYKHCCGRSVAVATPEASAEVEVLRALAAFRDGNADVAIQLLEGISPSVIAKSATALACGNACQEMARYELACTFYERAAALGETRKVSVAVASCCSQRHKPEQEASLLRVARKLIAALDRRRAHPAAGARVQQPIHIIGALGKIGGAEHHAVGLYSWLASRAAVRLWSTVPAIPEFAKRYPVETIDPARGHFPASGHLVFGGTYFEYGMWLEQARPARITICFNVRLVDTLIARLVSLTDIAAPFAFDLTYPSRTFRDALDLPGVVEYARVDTARFLSMRRRTDRAGPMVIGRHSRDDPMKFHPNDPAFYRRTARDGHQVRILGGTCLSAALGGDLHAGSIRLLPERREGVREFLDELDCFVYRIHPHAYEAGGTVIHEAMALALPVIVFADRVGASETIENGKNGYLVSTEEEALARIGELARDPALRRFIGAAARETVVALMNEQRRSGLDYYDVDGETDRCAEPPLARPA